MPSIFDPWLWIAIAAVLAAIEMFMPGYLLLGFGIGGGVVAIALFPLGEAARALPYAPLTLLAIWAALSIIAWMVLVAVFGRPSRRRKAERDINDFDNTL